MSEYEVKVVPSGLKIKCGEWWFTTDSDGDFVVEENPLDDEINGFCVERVGSRGIDNWIKEAKQFLACLEKIKEHFDAS